MGFACQTVGELITALENYDKNTPLVEYQSDMEKSGFFPNVHITLEIMKKVTKDTWDCFDGGNYSYDCFTTCKEDEEGATQVLRIL